MQGCRQMNMNDMKYRPKHVIEFWKQAYLVALRRMSSNEALFVANNAMKDYEKLCNKTLTNESFNE